MRRRQLKRLWARLKTLADMAVSREERLMRLGAARAKAPSAWRLVKTAVDKTTGALTFSLDRKKLRKGQTPRGSLSVADQPDRRRSRQALAVLHSTRRRGGSVQNL